MELIKRRLLYPAGMPRLLGGDDQPSPKAMARQEWHPYYSPPLTGGDKGEGETWNDFYQSRQ